MGQAVRRYWPRPPGSKGRQDSVGTYPLPAPTSRKCPNHVSSSEELGPGYCKCSSWGIDEAIVAIDSSSTESGTKMARGKGEWNSEKTCGRRQGACCCSDAADAPAQAGFCVLQQGCEVLHLPATQRLAGNGGTLPCTHRGTERNA